MEWAGDSSWVAVSTEVNLQSTAERVLMKSSFGTQSTVASASRLGYRVRVRVLLLVRGESGLARGMRQIRELVPWVGMVGPKRWENTVCSVG